MGVIGAVVGGEIGSHLGQYVVGKINPKYADSGGRIGAAIGNFAGAFAPYKTGGYIKGKKNRPIPIIGHGGEFILSMGNPPTKKQEAFQTNLKSVEKRKMAKACGCKYL